MVTNSSGSALLFRGAGVPTSGLEIAESRTESPNWFRLVERGVGSYLDNTPGAKELYGDFDKGATLEQAWRLSLALFGLSWVCLLAKGRPKSGTEGIDRVMILSPRRLISTLEQIFKTTLRRLSSQIFYHDGRIGHSVTILNIEDGQCFYHDPWPEGSLLRKGNNAAGVDAKRAGDRWRITTTELRKVIVAAFVFPSHFAEVSDVEYAIMQSDLEKGEFWSFFNIHEVPGDSQTQLESGDVHSTKSFKTGGFQDKIDLSILVNNRGRVLSARLLLDRDFVTGPPWGINPFAVDVSKSFLAEFTPVPDRRARQAIHDVVASITRQEVVREMMAKPEMDALLGPFVATYLGVHGECTRAFPFSNITFKNIESSGQRFLSLEVKLW